VLVGDLTRAAAAGALEGGLAGERVIHAADTEEALRLVPPLLESGDVVLVKGSRLTGLDRLVKALIEREREKEFAA
jgi:UDP-N-acetylmuramyl pentapeptide synthase